jgi:hypothetical protein
MSLTALLLMPELVALYHNSSDESAGVRTVPLSFPSVPFYVWGLS